MADITSKICIQSGKEIYSSMREIRLAHGPTAHAHVCIHCRKWHVGKR
jgi:hypothetical protein